MTYHFTRLPFAYALNIYMTNIRQGMDSCILQQQKTECIHLISHQM